MITNRTKRDLGNKRNTSPAPPRPLSDREARSIDNGSERGLNAGRKLGEANFLVVTLRIIWHRSLLDIWHNGADGLPAYLTAQNFVEYSSQTRMLS